MIEEFMLAANEAVAGQLDDLDIAFLRRVHPAPDPTKLQRFAEFARLLGYRVDLDRDRFALQRVLEESAKRTGTLRRAFRVAAQPETGGL